jgi:hypothetical protein
MWEEDPMERAKALLVVFICLGFSNACEQLNAPTAPPATPADQARAAVEKRLAELEAQFPLKPEWMSEVKSGAYLFNAVQGFYELSTYYNALVKAGDPNTGPVGHKAKEYALFFAHNVYERAAKGIATFDELEEANAVLVKAGLSPQGLKPPLTPVQVREYLLAAAQRRLSDPEVLASLEAKDKDSQLWLQRLITEYSFGPDELDLSREQLETYGIRVGR